MRKFFQYMRLVFTAGLPILFYDLFFLLRYSKHPEKYPLELRYRRVRKLILMVVHAFHVDLIVKHPERLNVNERMLYVSNHHSEADPLIYIALNEKPITFAAKEESLKMPFVGTVVKVLSGIPLDRANIMNQIKEIKQIIDSIKNPEKPIVHIFVEGTRNRHPENDCLEFKGGSFKLGYMAGVSIVPLTIYGTFRLFSIKHYLKRYPVYVEVGEPITKEEYKPMPAVDLADRVKKYIDTKVDEFRYQDSIYVYRHNKLPLKRLRYEIKCDKRF